MNIFRWLFEKLLSFTASCTLWKFLPLWRSPFIIWKPKSRSLNGKLIDSLVSLWLTHLIYKHPYRDVLIKRCFEDMPKIYRRTPIPKCNINKVALQLYWNRTSAWVFSCKFATYFQTPFLKNTYGELLMLISKISILRSYMTSQAFWLK